ncbi:MAG: tetratricopeptide repeat protein [Deltaproteobacteria bacterium]|nr:tetratricopeptide repeat protein [Deltaproteobacteria bacterium]
MKAEILLILLFSIFIISWDPFVIEVEQVKKANSFLKDKKYDKAEELYLEALSSRGKSLKLKFNLGLSQLAQGKFLDAEKSFQSATASENRKLRENSFYFQGIARFNTARSYEHSKKKQIKEAVATYQQSAESFKRAIELNTASESAIHNYEMALEKIEELKKEQEKQERQQKKEQQKKDQQKKDQQKKDQDKKDQQKKDQNQKDQDKNGQNKDQQKKDQQKKDQQKKDQQKKDQQKKDQQKKDQQKKDQQKKDQQKKDQQKKDQQKKDQQQQSQDDKQNVKKPKKLSPEQKAAVKALNDLEQRQKARQKELYKRMGKNRRAPIKDW